MPPYPSAAPTVSMPKPHNELSTKSKPKHRPVPRALGAPSTRRSGRMSSRPHRLARRVWIFTAGASGLSIGICRQAQSISSSGKGGSCGMAGSWWTFKNADVERHVLTLAKSRDIPRFDHLQRQRLLYRLALGHPNQEDLVNHLARGSDNKILAMSQLALDLRPQRSTTNAKNSVQKDHMNGD